MGDWGSMFSAFMVAVLILVAFIIVISLVSWACGPRTENKKCCSRPTTCPVFVKNPRPDDKTFSLARVDGSIDGTNNCSTGSFTLQRTSCNQLLYTVTTPINTSITDIYTLEVACESDFPLTPDGCAVNLTAYNHEIFPCDSTSNVQTLTSTLSDNLACRRNLFISVLVVFSANQETCEPLQMMTISGAASKPITLTGSCTTIPCPIQSCCDPIIPSFIKIHLPPCTTISSSPTAIDMDLSAPILI